MALHEAIFASACPTAASGNSGTLSVLDYVTGASLASFKPCAAPAHGTVVVETRGADGGVLFALQDGKPVLNCWSFQKDQVMAKMVLPEKLTCIAIDTQARWLAGGTAAGRVYLWEVASGILWNAWDAHYRRVSVLRFTSDGFGLLSGSDDAGISVWSISDLLDVDNQNEVPTPWTSLSDHTLPVTDIAVGLGTFPRLRVFTASADHTVKVWDLATKALLSTFHMPSPLSHIVVDPSERAFFASSALSTGEIYQVNLFAPRASTEAEADAPLIALGGHGCGDVIRIDAGGKRLFAAGQAVSALALSLTGTTLLAGTTAGKVLLFDVASHQLLRSFVLGAPVTYLASGLRPPDLAGHVRLGGGRDARAPVPRHVAPLQRTRDEKARLAHEAWVRLPEASVELDEIEYDDDELAADLAFFTRPAETRAGSGVGGAERVHELEEEVARLRAELGKAKGLNDKMWDAVVTTVMKEAAPATTQVETEDHGRAKKKRK